MINVIDAVVNWETFAMLLGLLYIVLIIRQSIWAWPSAFVSTFIYTLLFWEGQLPLQSVLNAYYLGMAVYGFWLWRRQAHATQLSGKPAPDDTTIPHQTAPLQIHRLSFHNHLLIIISGTLISWALGAYLTKIEFSVSPYLDAAVMVFSMMNTYLVARKVLENWLYWMVINSVAIYLYWQTEFYSTVVLMAVYLVMAVIGYQKWRAVFVQNQPVASATS